jgi:hypothetical protein
VCRPDHPCIHTCVCGGGRVWCPNGAGGTPLGRLAAACTFTLATHNRLVLCKFVTFRTKWRGAFSRLSATHNGVCRPGHPCAQFPAQIRPQPKTNHACSLPGAAQAAKRPSRHGASLRPSIPAPVCLLRIFGRIQNRFGADGGWRPAIIRLRGGRNQKRFLTVLTIFGSPAALFRGFGARGGCAHPAQRLPRLCAPYWVCPSRQTINGSRWRVPRWQSKRRSEPMPIQKQMHCPSPAYQRRDVRSSS